MASELWVRFLTNGLYRELFTYGLFNDVYLITQLRKVGRLENNGLEGMWKEAVYA